MLAQPFFHGVNFYSPIILRDYNIETLHGFPFSTWHVIM